MSTTAFIPVRGGSKSIPMKNVKPFCGKPLVYWTAKAANDSVSIDRVIIASDSREILGIAESFSLEKVSIYERNPINAQDTSSTESVMLEYINAACLDDDDVFVLVQATSPLTRAQDIDGAMRLFRERGYDSLLTCSRTKRFFWNQDGTPINYDYKARPRRQDFAGTLMENGAFYISNVKAVRESGCRLSGRIAVYEMPEYCGVEIDEPSDWKAAEELMMKHAMC